MAKYAKGTHVSAHQSRVELERLLVVQIIDMLDSGDDRVHTGVLAAADLRVARANAASQGGWRVGSKVPINIYKGSAGGVEDAIGVMYRSPADALLVTVEADPSHVHAEARVWRTIAECHELGWTDPRTAPRRLATPQCKMCCGDWPCSDLSVVIEAVRVYLSNTTGVR